MVRSLMRTRVYVSRNFRRALLGIFLYVVFCAIAGVFVADASLHPARRELTDTEITAAREYAHEASAGFEDASLTAPDGVLLRAWLIRPNHGNGDAVILLHGVANNRVGMTGYARLLLAHGFTLLMPDARAHGASGGAFTTYGLIERDDIRQWVDSLEARDHPRCIFGLGESMGAAQLLQSLGSGVHFCAVAAESSFANFREIAYDRMGQPFGIGPWFGTHAAASAGGVRVFAGALEVWARHEPGLARRCRGGDVDSSLVDSWAGRQQYSGVAFAADSCTKSAHSTMGSSGCDTLRGDRHGTAGI
jgi:pimeloyl-ACP methyl ester carboxylesterase